VNDVGGWDDMLITMAVGFEVIKI